MSDILILFTYFHLQLSINIILLYHFIIITDISDTHLWTLPLTLPHIILFYG
jgi:hypothetical protein